MIELTKASEAARRIADNKWVQWIHVSKGISHCKTCLKLHECCFVSHKAPPVGEDAHPHCHCYYKDIPQIEATAACNIGKFTEYTFVWREEDDKSETFHKLGYTVEDSEWLRSEFMRQAKITYECGEYELRKLDQYGQRIRMETVLPDRIRGGTVKFYTGWIIGPNGHIQLTTTFTGRIE